MTELFPELLKFDSLRAANSVFLLGLIMFLGALGGVVFRRLKIPQVVGYIVIGIAIGQSGSRLISGQVISTLEPISGFALSLIGFLIGSELKLPLIKKYGRQFASILAFETLIPFIVVSVLVGAVSYAVSGNPAQSIALAILLGAISSATAPAATTDVLSENRSKGPLTTMVLGIVAMDDAVALILFAIASTVASSLIGTESVSLLSQLLEIARELSFSIGLGSLFGFALSLIIKIVRNDDGRVLAFSLGGIMIMTGLAAYLEIDAILTAMSCGFFIANFAPFRSRDLFDLVDRFTPPVYVLFFVLVGAKLDIWKVSPLFGVIALIYVVGRTVGKSIGSRLGARLSGAPPAVVRYLPWCLLSQAGVAIGLSILAGRVFPETLGPTIILVVTATTFIVQLIGPLCVKYGIARAGECGLDVTEDDILKESRVADVIGGSDRVMLLTECAPFKDIVESFGKQESLSTPVVSPEGKLIGIITVDNLKEAFLLGEMTDALLACDVMNPCPAFCSPEDNARDARDVIREGRLDTLPVVGQDGKVQGVLEDHMVIRYVNRRVLELRERETRLECAR